MEEVIYSGTANKKKIFMRISYVKGFHEEKKMYART